MQTERQALGHIPLSGSVGGVLWASQARAGLVNSSRKSGVLVRSTGVLSQGRIRHTGRGDR